MTTTSRTDGLRTGGHIIEIKFNIDGGQRKSMAHTISELSDYDAEYMGAPTFVYRIGDFTLDKNGVLSFSDRTDSKIVERVLDGLHLAGYEAEHQSESLTLQMPKNEFTDAEIDNLKKIVANKAKLIKHALDTESLDINETDEALEFPWFTPKDENDSDAYIKFITMLCSFAKEHKRVVIREDTSDNEKYAFRCFLLRLGMIGSDYKAARKVLLRNLTGSSAFRSGQREGVCDAGE